MHSNRPTFQAILRGAVAAICCTCVTMPSTADAQVRTKRPDRDVYRSPRMDDQTSGSGTSLREVMREEGESTSKLPAEPGDATPTSRRDELVEVADHHERVDSQRHAKTLVEVPVELAGAAVVPQVKRTATKQRSVDSPDPNRSRLIRPVSATTSQGARRGEAVSDVQRSSHESPKLRPVAHQDVVLVRPQHAMNTTPPAMHTIPQPIVDPDDQWVEESHPWHPSTVLHDSTCDGCGECDSLGCDSLGCDSVGCDSMGCDSMGCDSMGCDPCWYRDWMNSSLSWDRDRWFGSVELLLMFRRGDRPPTLVTTGPSTDPDTAGEIGQAGTQVLVGGNSILKNVTAGGRFTLGTWIDPHQCRSLVLRGWFAGEKDFGFHANQDQIPVIARPFLNVSDNQAAEQDTQLVAFPNRVSGRLDIHAKSDVYGADVSLRQFWYGKYGGTIDFLYGYQYMRLKETLGISSTSTSLDDDFAPVGAMISIADAFEAENDFHGGQVGVASRYREGCWSFNALAKVGFGSLRRRAQLSGSTVTSIDGVTAVDPNGLLVRSTNEGTITDHTFGWVPELDLSIGWQRYPRFDVTFGYHVIAMTDALQVSGVIDPTPAVNLSDPPTGQQRPAALLNFETYYVQGIHFGVQHVY